MIKQLDNSSMPLNHRKWQLLPYVILGLVLFAFTSTLNVNYFLKGYVTIIEIQMGIVALYFLLAKRKQSRQNKS